MTAVEALLAQLQAEATIGYHGVSQPDPIDQLPIGERDIHTTRFGVLTDASG